MFSPVWDLPVPKFSGFKGKVLEWVGTVRHHYLSERIPDPGRRSNDAELESSCFFEDANTPTVNGPVQFVKPKTHGGICFNSYNFTDATTANPSPAGVFGNTPHSLCCGPAISNTDFVLTKKTPITERWNTEFRAEFFNLESYAIP